MLIQLRAKAILLAIAATVAGIAQAGATEVNLYSYREPQRIVPLLRAFHAATGIRVNVTFASKDLIERIAAEGERSPADVLLTNEYGLLLDARQRGLTQAFKSPIVEANVPAIYRDPEGHWVGLTRRARLFVVSAKRVSTDTITYEDLAEPRWKGKICIRSGRHPYNTALIASMLAHHGPQKTEAWLRGVKANLARAPSGGDRDQVRAVMEGVCDVAVVNSYYAANFLFIDQELREQKHRVDPSPVSEHGGSRYARCYLGCCSLEAFPQQGRRHQADRAAHIGAGAAHVQRRQRRVPCERGRDAADADGELVTT